MGKVELKLNELCAVKFEAPNPIVAYILDKK